MATKLYVGNLPDNCREDTIRDLFGSYGDMTDELVMIKNYAFVHFKNVEDANSAVRDLNGTKMLGKQLTVEISKSKGGKDKSGDRRNQSRDNQSGDRRNQSWDNQRRDYPTRYGNHNNSRFPKDNRQWNGDQNNIGSMMGGILGNIPNALDTIAPLGDFGILSAVNTLAAVAEKQRNMQQQRNMESFPEYRNNRDPEHDRMDLGSKQDGNIDNGEPGNSSGYVIYERYYVDRNHPLLNGLPLPKLPHIEDDYVSRTKNFTDNFASLDTKLSDPYSHVDVDSYHRGQTNRMNMDHDRDSNKFRI